MATHAMVLDLERKHKTMMNLTSKLKRNMHKLPKKLNKWTTKFNNNLNKIPKICNKNHHLRNKYRYSNKNNGNNYIHHQASL